MSRKLAGLESDLKTQQQVPKMNFAFEGFLEKRLLSLKLRKKLLLKKKYCNPCA